MSLAFVGVSNQSTQKAEITLAGSMAELGSPAAAQMAIQEALKLGLNRPGLNTSPGAYPVDEEGNSDEDVIMGRKPVAGYRRTFQIAGMPS